MQKDISTSKSATEDSRYRHLAIALVAVLPMLGAMDCSKSSPTSVNSNNNNNDGNTLNPNAGTLSSHAGNNAAVTDTAKAASVGSSVQSNAITAAGKAIAIRGSPKLLLAAAATGTTINGTVHGTNSGTAIADGTYSVNQSTGQIHYDITLTFNDYSDDDVLFLGGQMHFLYDITVNTATYQEVGTYTITGNIRFDGSFVGTNEFSYDYSINTATQSYSYIYTSTIVSNGRTITWSYRYPAT